MAAIVVFLVLYIIGGVVGQGTVQVELESSELVVSEEDGNVDICVQVLSGTVTTLNTVTLSTVAGSATVEDYTPLLDVELIFTVGATRVCETLSIMQDALVEGNEFFTVTITRTNASLGEITSTQVTIDDDDEITVGLIESTFTVIEGEAAVICAEIQGGRIERPVVVNIDALLSEGDASAKQDYSAISNQRTFNPVPQPSISSPVCANFSTIDENSEFSQNVLVEDVEFFIVTLNSSDSVNVIPELSQARVFIIDNDGATVRVGSSDMSVVEGDEGDRNTVDVCLELVDIWGGLERELQFNLSLATMGTAASDDLFPLEPTLVTFPSTSVVGDSVCQQYTIIGDDVKEADETFTVSVSAVNSIDIINGTDQSTVTITDDGDLRQDCGPLENPENGIVMVSPSTLDGSVATYSCNTGFTLDGSVTRTCQLNPPTIPGVWSGEAPSCIILSQVDCGDPPGPGPDGDVDFTQTTFGLSATYTCTTPCYRLAPNTPTRTCLASGMWSGDNPTCQFVDCGAPPNVTGCSVAYTSTDCGSEASYMANIGNMLIGDATLMCDQSGNWNEDPSLDFPHCPEGPQDCVTVHSSFEPVFVSTGRVCFQCSYGSGVATDSTFQIDNADVNSSVGTVSMGVLVIFDAAQIFSSATATTVRCSSGGSTRNFLVFLRVFQPPLITGEIIINEGDTLSLDCDTSNSLPPPTSAWFTPQGDTISSNRSLTIENITRSQAGQYTCVATESESGNTQNSTVNVTVQYVDISHSVSMGVIDIPLGGTLQLTCNYEGVPPTAHIMWEHNATTLQESDPDITIDVEDTNTTLTRSNLQADGGGFYNCSATNVVGTTTDTAIVRIQLPPGAPTNLTVIGRTTSSLLIAWTNPVFNGFSPITLFGVSFTNERTMLTTNRAFEGSAFTSQHNITNLSPLTRYSIELHVRNEVNLEGDAATVQGTTLSLRLGPITNPIIHSNTSTQIHVQWQAPSFNPATTASPDLYELTHRETINEDNATVREVPPPASPDTLLAVTIDGLKKGTVYVVSVTPFNSRGAGETFTFQQIETAVDPPTPPRNFTATAVDQFTIQVTWTAPEDDGGRLLTMYHIELHISSNATTFITVTELGESARNYTIENLMQNTTYELAITVINADGLVSFPVTRLVTTLPVGPPLIPSSPTISDITNVSAIVSWTDPGGFIDLYIIQFKRHSDDWDNGNTTTAFATSSNTLSHLLSDLEPLTSYDVRVQTQNTIDVSAFSTETTFSTFGSILIQGPGETVTPGMVIQLHCTLEGDDGNNEIQYRWSRHNGSLPTNSQTSGGTLTLNSTLKEDSGLYLCTAQEVTGTILLTIESDVPGPVSNIHVIVNGGNITISWNAAESNGAQIIEYLVRILSGSQVDLFIALTTDITLNRTQIQSKEDRSMDVVYVVRVSARNEVGQGEESEQTFTLPAAMPPSIRVTGNRSVVEPGRPVSIECHSFGEFSGEVEWKRQTASGETQSIPTSLEAVNGTLIGMLIRQRNGSSSEALTTGQFGIRSTAQGVYVCVADNGMAQSTLIINITVPELLPQHVQVSSYIRFSIESLEDILRGRQFFSLSLFLEFLNTAALSSINETRSGLQEFICTRVPSGAGMNDRVECKFNNYNDSAMLGEADIANLQLALAENGVPLDPTTEVVVSESGFCDISDTNNSMFGDYQWPETKVGGTAILSCVFVEEGESSMVSRTCFSMGNWSNEPNFEECSTRITVMYQGFDSGDINAENVVAMLDSVMQLVEMTSSQRDQSMANLMIILNVVSASRDAVGNTSLNTSEVAEIVNDVVLIIDDVQNWPVDQLQQDGSNLVEVFEEIASLLALRDNNRTVLLNVTGDTTAMIVERNNADKLQEFGREFSAYMASDGSLSTSSASSDQVASIQLPPSLFNRLTGVDDRVGLVFTVYAEPVLFPLANTTQGRSEIRSPIIGAIVAGVFPIANLTEPVEIHLALSLDDDDEVFTSVTCVSWDFSAAGGRGNWTDRGCRTVSNDVNNEVTCYCNHLTNFAALVDICSRTEDDCQTDISSTEEIALSAISIVGTTLSIIGLFLTIFTMLIFKKLRDRDASKFHIQLCLALLCMLLVFVTGIDRTEVFGGCVAVSALIQYFTLAAVMWMGAEAVLMYKKLVVIFVRITTCHIIIISLICWLVPIIPVIIPLAIDRKFMVSYKNTEPVVNSTRQEEIDFCFIGEVGVFFGLFLVPILLVFLFNSIIFVLVSKVLIQHHRKGLGKEKDSSADTGRLFISIFGVMVLFGLTWIFGAFTISGASIAFQFIFAICNSLQGFFLFLLFCVIGKEARESWITHFCCCQKVDRIILTTPNSKESSTQAPVYSSSFKSSSDGYVIGNPYIQNSAC